MKGFKKRYVFIVLFFVGLFPIKNGIAQPKFIQNMGQFHPNSIYQLNHGAGKFYFEKNKVKYQLFEKNKLDKLKHGKSDDANIKTHTYETEFLKSNGQCIVVGEHKFRHHENYFIGNDSSKWKSNVPSFKKIVYQQIYPGIDLIYYEKFGHLKYDFIVQPKHHPKNIQIQYNGLNNMYLKAGHLVLETSLGNIVEQAPLAYQIIDDKKIVVSCEFFLNKNVISFKFPEGYQKKHPLIIDPVLIFSTYSGSSANNWGQTATNDNAGHLYAGSISFAIGYPTTLGPYQALFAGGDTDMCITKFSVDGTTLLYSTYLGGGGNENPHSLVVNDNDELFVLGSTGSANFPTTANAYDNSFNGGSNWGFIGSYIPYPNGIDIVVTKFSSNGNNLLSSTFVGGTGNDGINESGANVYNNSGLCNFYADEYRGEIILDDAGNCYVASTSKSNDFPMVSASQSTNGGLQDAIAFKLNSNLSNLLWSTYYGGSQNDAAYSLQINNLGDVYITGGTMSSNLTTTSNSAQPIYNGGVDGFIAKFDGLNNLSAATYVGNGGYNQNYFVQIDINNNIFICGLSQSAMPVFPTGIYNTAGSQFIQKYTSDLSTISLSSTFGTGAVVKTITPTAFLVSDCGLIYVCGWGGLNGTGTTNNLPLTSNAFQSTTDGSDFYLGVFEEDMQSLLYGTYFGGNQSDEHVDGGTSRFDKNGKVYQAVCAGCFNNNDFPTTPGAWSTTNGSSTNCNLGVFKFALEDINTAISVPNYFACLPNSYQFSSQSTGGNLYYWDFGDGNTSNLMSPSHLYADTGIYTVSLIVADSISCVMSDTAIIQLHVYGEDNAQIIGDSLLCPGSIATLTAYGGTQYSWFPSASLSSPNGQQVVATPTSTTTYMVIAIDSCGVDSAFFEVQVANDLYQISSDSSICVGDSLQLWATGGLEYRWMGNFLMNQDSANPIVYPQNNQYYFVEITSPNGCIFQDSVFIQVDQSIPSPIMEDSVNLCQGDSVLLDPGNIDNAIWYPNNNLISSSASAAISFTDSNQLYYFTSTNACGSLTDSVQVLVFGYSGQAFGNSTICPGDTTYLYAEDGVNYFWFPSYSLSNSDSCCTFAFPTTTTNYQVIVENAFGCADTFRVDVNVNPIPFVSAGQDIWIQYGEEVYLSGNTDAPIYYWEGTQFLSCTNCLSPQITTPENTYYVLHATDSLGCSASDTVQVNMEGILYVPNTFTPNNDGVNDFFEIKGENINEFELWIYNRWGEEIYYTNVMTDYWDGFYKGKLTQIDGYSWKIRYSDYNNTQYKKVGFVCVAK